MRNRFNLWLGAGFGMALLGCAFALPAVAADDDEKAADTTMPTTEHQAEQMRNVPDGAEGTSTGEQVPQSDGMPATKAQTEELKESDKMSRDKDMKASDSDS